MIFKKILRFGKFSTEVGLSEGWRRTESGKKKTYVCQIQIKNTDETSLNTNKQIKF